MKTLVREPLLFFLVLGAGLFAVYHLVAKRDGDRPSNIVVTQGQIDQLVSGFTKAWQRPPTQGELAGLIRDRVREEIYCREAMAIGLDKDDTIIRRRLRQKMEFVSDDIAAVIEATDADLSAYLQSHLDAFRLPARLTFSHVYLQPAKHGKNLARDAQELLAKLNQMSSPADISALGDSFLLERQFTSAPCDEIARQFGDSFTAKLTSLAPGQWQGPFESGYGVHLVLLSERTEARLPALPEVRDAVRREWNNSRRLEANENFYKELLKRYTVTVEGLATEPVHLALTGSN
jgi:hypothetical protein